MKNRKMLFGFFSIFIPPVLAMDPPEQEIIQNKQKIKHAVCSKLPIESKELIGHTDTVYSLHFNKYNNRFLTSDSYDKTSRIWDLQEQKERMQLGCHKGYIISADFNKDDTQFAKGCEDGTVKIWDLHTKEEITKLIGHTHWVTSVTFNIDDTQLASGSADGIVRVWDLRKLNAALYILDNEVSLSEANAAVEWAKEDDDSEIPIKQLRDLLKKE